jgi:hypothetical protein
MKNSKILSDKISTFFRCKKLTFIFTNFYIEFITMCFSERNGIVSKKGHKLSYKTFNSNFILDYEHVISPSQSAPTKKGRKKYDLIISNPPYYKISIHSPESQLLKNFVFGQPCISENNLIFTPSPTLLYPSTPQIKINDNAPHPHR